MSEIVGWTSWRRRRWLCSIQTGGPIERCPLRRLCERAHLFV